MSISTSCSWMWPFYNQRVMGPAHVENVVDEAIKTALAHRGVAHITIPKDIQEWKASDGQRSNANVPGPQRRPVSPGASRSRRETRLRSGRADDLTGQEDRDPGRTRRAGRAQRGAGSWPRSWRRPIIKALLGKAVVPDDSPYTTGGIGLLGTAPSQDAMQECDTPDHGGHAAFPYIEFSAEARPGEDACRSTSTRPASGCALPWMWGWWATARRTAGAADQVRHRQRRPTAS